MTGRWSFLVLFLLCHATVRADSLVCCDRSQTYQIALDKESKVGEASLREHTIVWHPAKKKYYLLADVVPLTSQHHPNTYNTEIHLFSSPNLQNWTYHGVAIPKGTKAGRFDRFGVASPASATFHNGLIYCPYSARRTSHFTERSIGLACSHPDPEQLPWQKTTRPIADLTGEDDDAALISDASDNHLHLYFRTASSQGYHILHSQSSHPLKEDSWSKPVKISIKPEGVRAQELTGAALLNGEYHLFVIEHFYQGGAQVAHLTSQNAEGPFHEFDKEQRYLLPEEQPPNIVYSGHITPVVREGAIKAFFWTVSQTGKRYGLLGHPVLKPSTD
ncbi:MAG: hypothetical protein NXI29_25185 [bacterium]|nr:hypothetical protein [bacterium]